MGAFESRSPSPSSRRCRCGTWSIAVVTILVLLVPLVCVGAFAGRGCGSSVYHGLGGSSLVPTFQGRQANSDGGERVEHHPDISENLPPSHSPAAGCSTEAGLDALGLASTARGGGGGGERGWWFPGKRARRRRNLERAAQRAAAKRAAVAGGENELPRGLANQGNTCYLNSLLQTLYHAPGLREAVFEALSGRGGEGPTVSALATVFQQLDEGVRPASTLPLTRAMGVDPRVQQDAQEFGRFLFMALEGESPEESPAPSTQKGEGKEGKDEGKGLAGAINNLFAGRLMNYIECVDLPFSKEKEEVFYDLPLDIKGSGTLRNSLDRFVEAELMSGENRWRAGEHGLQEARKGVRFLELPPVLQFHLKRFEYDPYQDDLAKIHDRFEFPTKLDMSPWLQKGLRKLSQDATDGRADGGSIDEGCRADHVSSSYKLSAVVMHVGGPAAGHYYAYVRYKTPAGTPPKKRPTPPSKSTLSSTWPESTKTAIENEGGVSSAPPAPKAASAKLGGGREASEAAPTSTVTWVKLDDHRVTKVSEAEVLRDAFGGGGGVYDGPGADLQHLFGQGSGAGRGGTASAYMLQYVKDEEPKENRTPAPTMGVPLNQGKSECAQP